MRVVLSSEHGGKRVPARFEYLFQDDQPTLDSHLGWDPGSLQLARQLARRLKAPLVHSTVTRLLIDQNRSHGHAKLFSSWSKQLPREERQALIEQYWRPYHDALVGLLGGPPRESVLHLSVHSFTPIWRGKPRNVDVGLLYDPSRLGEQRLVDRWLQHLAGLDSTLVLRRNQPYRGTSDGLTSEFRKRFVRAPYLGIELEVSQRFPLGNSERWKRLRSDLIASLKQALEAA